MEKVDSNGILPIHWTDRIFLTAFSFRRFLQNNIEPHLHSFPSADPFAEGLCAFDDQMPGKILERWPPANEVLEFPKKDSLDCFPIDHSVASSPIRGGERAANKTLKVFLKDSLDRYSDCRNHPDDEATSGLSPYLHFGHISVHQIFHELARLEGWSGSKMFGSARGQREGWWGMRRNAEAFLDQLITWRELGYKHVCSFAHLRPLRIASCLGAGNPGLAPYRSPILALWN